MTDKILSHFDEIQRKKEKSEGLLNKLKSEYEFLLSVKSCTPVHNSSVNRCLDILEKLMVNDEKLVLSERQFFKEFTELLDFVSEEDRREYFKRLLAVEVDALEITAGYTEEGWVYVRAPGFLPTEKEMWLSSEFFKPIFQELSLLNPEYKTFKERCFVVIVQNIEEGTSSQLRDADNREHRNLSNMLTRTFLVDDTPYYCDYLYASLFKDTSYVEAFVIPENEAYIFIKRLCNNDITPKKLLKTIPFSDKMM